MKRHAETVMVRGEHAPHGERGEKLLVNGKQMAMRLWEHEEVGTKTPNHSNTYEYVAYVVEGRLRITIDEHSFEVQRGDSYCVPAETPYSLEVLEPAMVVEATSPSDRGAVTQTDKT